MFQELALASRKARERNNEHVVRAWMGEFFARQKKLKKPQAYPFWQHGPVAADRKQLQAKALLYRIAAQYGLKVQREGT